MGAPYRGAHSGPRGTSRSQHRRGARRKDKDLTADARKRKRHERARQTMEQLEKLSSTEKARESVAAIQARWQAKIDAVLTRPTADARQQQRCSGRFVTSLQTSRTSAPVSVGFQRYGNDPLIPSALLHGPAGLTGLSEAERALLTNKVEALADPKITEAKSKVTRALAELERSYRAAPALVAQCAGLDKAIAARPLPGKPELPTLVSKTPAAAPSEGNTPATPKATTPKATPPKANRPNWPSNSSSPAMASGPNWT